MKNIVATFLFVILSILLFESPVNSQIKQYQPDKAGKFIVQNLLNDCPGVDKASLASRLTAITDWVHQNDQIMYEPKGFEASVHLSGNLCDKPLKEEDFGIQSSVYFSFHYFYTENGIAKTANDWAAHGTEILINNPYRLVCSQLTEAEFKSGDPQSLKQPLEKALKNLEKYYTVAPVEKDIAPGVRLYKNGSLLVFNPERPDIIILVTVKEIMETKLAYYKIKQEIDSINYEKTLVQWAKLNYKPDKQMRPDLYNLLKKEYENFTEEELNKLAYSGSTDNISTINAQGIGNPVARINSSCWDRTMPVSAVQFLSMKYRLCSSQDMEIFKKHNDGLIDYVGLYNNNLPVEKLGVLIQRK